MNKKQKDATEQDAAEQDVVEQGVVEQVVVAAQSVQEVMQEPEGGWPADEYTGKAGSYVRDPFTGLRHPAVEAGDGDVAAAA